MSGSSSDDHRRPTRQEANLAATDRAARDILRSEAEARRDQAERLKAIRLEREAGRRPDDEDTSSGA
ncbi:hypothetical protein [Roseicyclus sp.]|uniref:hypothetical protein n=1 Tax=Roseicyclus sp. TaxID=1914329 RepID=UPI003F9EDCEC